MPQLRCTGRLCPGPAFSPASLALPQTAAEVPRGALGQPPQEQALCQWAQESRSHLQLGHAVSPLSIVHPLTSRPRAPENRALDFLCICPHSLVTQTVKNPPARQEVWVRSLGREDPLEEGMATHSSILVWRIPTDRGAWRAAAHVIGHN